jgi:hypothetical protein
MGSFHGSGNWLQDTDDKTLRVWTEVTRRLSPSQKVNQLFELCEALESLQRAGVRKMHPDASEREVFLRVAERRLGPELMRKAYGWKAKSAGE